MATTHLLYLHGFRSSPQSTKAQLTADYVAARHPGVQLWCPQLPPSPRAAMDLVLQGTADWPGAQMAVIGSSLGGYYASWVAQQRRCASVLLNPAVFPDRSLARHIGEQTAWHDPEARFFFRPEYLDELVALNCRDQPAVGPELGIFARGDELLDWREMVARYPQAEQIVLDGGDHALGDYAQYLPTIAHFLQLV